MAFQPLEPRKLFFGNPVFNVGALDGQNGFFIPGVEPSGELGFSVTAIGDLNADGIDDLAVSAPAAGSLPADGRIYVIFGAAGLGASGQIDLTALNGVNGFVITGPAEFPGLAGWSISSAGDINNDTIDDLVIGAPAANAAFVVFGSAGVGGSGTIDLDTLNGATGFRIWGQPSNDMLGFTVASAGDVNDDGINDILFGSPSSNGDQGIAYVIFGANGIGATGAFDINSIDGSNGLIIQSGNGTADQFAWRVAHIGDVNFDGVDDIAIGSLESSSNSSGSAYIFFGAAGIGSGTEGYIYGNTLDGTSGFKTKGLNDNNLLATSISGGDVNGDGIDDLILGSLTQSTYVVFGATGIGAGGQFNLATLDGTNGYVAVLPIGLAVYVAEVGDLNDDGFSDVAVGSAGTSEVFVFAGGPTVGIGGVLDLGALDGENGFVIQGVELNTGFLGNPIASGKDVNDDGRFDMLIGASVTNSNTGAAYVLFGVTVRNLTAPTNLTATALDEMSIELQWDDTTFFEDGFEIERSLDGVTGWTFIAPAPPSSGNSGSVTYQDGSLQPNTQYFYRVRAYNQLANSGYSNVASATTADVVPAAPSNLEAAALSDTQIRLTWTDNATNETGFHIYRIEGMSNTLVGTVGADVTTFDDSGLSPNTAYSYLVRAYNDVGESGDSNTAMATTGDVAPNAPSNLMAAALSNTSIRLTWDDNSNNENGFNIYRLEGEFMTLVGSVGANVSTFDDTGLEPATPYYYTVRAFNDTGESDDSNIAFAITDGGVLTVPVAPSGLSAVAISQSEIQLHWSDNSDNEEGFIIERAVDPNLIWFQIDTVQPNQTQYVNRNLPADSTYFYRIRAYNAAGTSAPSNVAGATTSSAQGGQRRVEFSDGDGDVAIFSLVGVGGTISFTTFGDGGGIDTLHVAPSQPGIGSLNVSIVQAVGGDGRVQIGKLQGDISLGDLFVRVSTINFGSIDIVGEGVWLCNVNRATFGDLTGSAVIQGQVADLTLRDVNTTGGISLCDVNSFKARSLTLGGGFDANSITSFTVDGDADFSLTTYSTSGLGSLRIGGNAMVSFDVYRADQINIVGDARFTGSSQIADRLGRLKVGGSWISGSLMVGQLANKIEIVGDAGASATLTSSGGCVVVCGDSSATFNLDHFVRFTVKGDLLGGNVNITESSDGVVCLKGDSVAGAVSTDAAGLWCLKVLGALGASSSFDSEGLLHKANIGGSLEGAISVAATDCIVVCGDFSGDLVANGSGGDAVGKFTVKGAANGARFAAVGDVNCIILGEMNQTEIYVGLATNWGGGLPSYLGDFVRQSVLRKLQVRGVTDGATIASASIANLCLNEITDQHTFHLGAGQVDRAKMNVESQSYILGFNKIFTDLPTLPYLDIVELLESGGG